MVPQVSRRRSRSVRHDEDDEKSGVREIDRIAPEHIGLQLHSVKEDAKRDLAGTLSTISQIGYANVEFAGYYGHEAQVVRDLLVRFDLLAPSAHVPLSLVRNDLQRAISGASVLKHQYLILSSFHPEIPATVAQFREMAKYLNRIGMECADHGVQFGYHTHADEFRRLDGIIPFRILLDETDPELVVMQIDTYWAVRGGADPTEFFRQYPGRFPLLHVKDIAKSPGINSVPVGSGRIDWSRLLAAATAAGTKHVIVEQEHFDHNPMDCLRESFIFLKNVRLS